MISWIVIKLTVNYKTNKPMTHERGVTRQWRNHHCDCPATEHVQDWVTNVTWPGAEIPSNTEGLSLRDFNKLQRESHFQKLQLQRLQETLSSERTVKKSFQLIFNTNRCSGHGPDVSASRWYKLYQSSFKVAVWAVAGKTRNQPVQIRGITMKSYFNCLSLFLV